MLPINVSVVNWETHPAEYLPFIIICWYLGMKIFFSENCSNVCALVCNEVKQYCRLLFFLLFILRTLFVYGVFFGLKVVAIISFDAYKQVHMYVHMSCQQIVIIINILSLFFVRFSFATWCRSKLRFYFYIKKGIYSYKTKWHTCTTLYSTITMKIELVYAPDQWCRNDMRLWSHRDDGVVESVCTIYVSSEYTNS